MNRRAFAFGRLAAHDPEALARMVPEALPGDRLSGEGQGVPDDDLDGLIARCVDELTRYQDGAYAARFSRRIAAIRRIEAERMAGSEALTRQAARALFKLMAYKDEYEIARLYVDGRFERALAETFEGDYRLEFHLSPALIAPRDPETGRPGKRSFGPWMMHVFRLLAKLKHLRGTRLDPFGWRPERRLERRLISDYERLLDDIAEHLSPETFDTALELAGLPLAIRGYGHVKEASAARARAREAELRAALHAPQPAPAPASRAAA